MGDFYNRGGGEVTATSVTSDDLEIDSGTLSIDATNNRVGMGTTSPGTQLQVESNTPYITLKNDTSENTDGGCESKVIFEDHGNNALGQIEVSHVGSSDDEKGQLIIKTNNDSGLQTALTISEAQKVTAAGDLQVTGDIILDDGGSLKEAGGTAAITFDGSGHVTKIGQDTHTSGQFLKWDGSKAVWDAVATGSSAADDISTGDAAVNIATTAGNITIDAQGNNTDIIFKGTDDGSDTTFLTIDGSAAGAATFNNKIVATELDISGDVDVDGTLEADAITLDGTALGSLYSPIAGSSSITTVGTVGTGTWQGTAIAQAYIANDAINGDKIADDSINSEHYVDGSIDTAHIADDQVTLDKMAGIARGKIIYGDASGNPAVLAPGSNNQVLTSDGTDISWQNAAAGGANADDSNTILHMQVFGR